MISLHLENSIVLASKLCVPASHSEAAQNSFVRPYLGFWLQKCHCELTNSGGGDKKSKTPVLTFGGHAGLRGFGVVGQRSQDSGWHKDMENFGNRARDAED